MTTNTTGVNSPVMASCLEVAKKLHVQDISYRAMAGRIKKVTGITFTPSELMVITEYDGDPISKSLTKRFDKWSFWVADYCGTSVINTLESTARPYLMRILELYVLGFIPKEVLVKPYKSNKKMLQETGGIWGANWAELVADIEDYQESRPKKKRKSTKK